MGIFRWPRGRFNGMRIVGVEIKVRIDVTDWLWTPVFVHHCGGIHWLFLRTWWGFSYRDEWR